MVFSKEFFPLWRTLFALSSKLGKTALCHFERGKGVSTVSATQPRAPINFYLFQQALAVAAAVDYVVVVVVVREVCFCSWCCCWRCCSWCCCSRCCWCTWSLPHPTIARNATQRKSTQLNSGTVASLSLALFFIATKKMKYLFLKWLKSWSVGAFRFVL